MTIFRPNLWNMIAFNKAVKDCTAGQRKIHKRDYLANGKIPVIDQGKMPIAGYTNDPDHQYKGDLPVVLFGDHTREIKYIDFPFALGADGVKALSISHLFIPKYLYYYWKSQPIPSRGYSRHFKFFREIDLPLIPLSEQRRIVEILDQADALRKKRAEAEAKAARILPALFYKMFGDPATNPMGWNVRPFGKVCVSRLGKMLDAKQQTGQHNQPYLRNANVHWASFDLSEVYQMDFNEKDRLEFSLKKGDLLICEGGEVGRCAIWQEEIPECYFQKALHRVRPLPGEAISEYLLYLIWEMAKKGGLRESTSSLTIAHLTGVRLKKLQIMVPPIEVQEIFANQVMQFNKNSNVQRLSHLRINELFTALLYRAFSGDLTAKWREAHMKELLDEMELQAKYLN